MIRLTRREWLRIGLGSAVGLRLGGAGLAAGAQEAGSPVLVVVMLRGGLDALSVLVPHRDPRYAAVRRATRIAGPGALGGALPLTDALGLHPSLAPLLPLYREGSLSFVGGFGSPSTTRSHFEAQRLMELGRIEADRQSDGFLNRASRGLRHGPDGLSAVATSPGLPLLLRGEAPVLALGAVPGQADPTGRNRSRQLGILGSLYPTGGDPVLEAGHRSVEMLRALEPALTAPSRVDSYPRGAFARSLAEIARLVRAGVGVPLYYAEEGGWDTHAHQGATDGPLARRLASFAQALAAFEADLGEASRDVVVVCFTEFGRTVRENGSGGTDHGHGSVALVLGGPVRGGRIVGGLPTLEEGSLYEARDLPVTVDYRDLFAELLVGHLGLPLAGVPFDGHAATQERFPGILSTA